MFHNGDFSGDVLIPLDSGDMLRIQFADMAALVAEAVRSKKIEDAERSTIEELLGMPRSHNGLLAAQGIDGKRPTIQTSTGFEVQTFSPAELGRFKGYRLDVYTIENELLRSGYIDEVTHHEKAKYWEVDFAGGTQRFSFQAHEAKNYSLRVVDWEATEVVKEQYAILLYRNQWTSRTSVDSGWCHVDFVD
jgi:hypothetical protein